MSDSPKFEVIDRRKYKAEQEELQAAHEPAAKEPEPAPEPEPPTTQHGPQLVVDEGSEEEIAAAESVSSAGMPPVPTIEESQEQKMAYDAAAQRLEDLVRAQNPAAGAQPPVSFEQLVQQFYLSAMIQMGAGTQEGQRPRIDILGARQTIDLLGVLAEKTAGTLTEAEDRMMRAVLFEARMAFLELTNMITLQGVPAPPPPAPGQR